MVISFPLNKKKKSPMMVAYVLAYTPPPLLLNPKPYVIAESARIPHPRLAVVEIAQSVLPSMSVPLIERVVEFEEITLHPVAV